MARAVLVENEFIFSEGVPFESCHAATLALLATGDALAAWFGGSEEGAEDVGIWLSRRTKAGWSAPRLLAGGEGTPHWNPVLFSPDGAGAILYYKIGMTIPGWKTMTMESPDGGETWSEARELVPGDVGGRGPVKNKPIVTSEGLVLAPASVEGRYWDAFVDRSEDRGVSWTASGLVAFPHDESYEGTGIIQPSLWESSPGKVHMLLRSRTARIWRSDSSDGGRTWGPAYPTWLPNNSSGIDLDRTPDGLLALAYNPVGMPKGPRTPLVLGVSADNGETWSQAAILETGPGEYSYPSVLARGNELHIVYTWNRTRIAYRSYRIEA
jgi:predicted neuraminidase